MNIKRIIKAVITGTAAGMVFYWFKKYRTSKLALKKEKMLLVHGIEENAPLFDGLYESLYQSVVQKSPDRRGSYYEWRIRVEHLEGQPEFSEAFLREFTELEQADREAYEKKAGLLLELIQQAGISRDQETELTICPEVLKAYLYLKEDIPQEGHIYKVMKPAWRHKGKVVEQGILLGKEMEI